MAMTARLRPLCTPTFSSYGMKFSFVLFQHAIRALRCFRCARGRSELLGFAWAFRAGYNTPCQAGPRQGPARACDVLMRAVFPSIGDSLQPFVAHSQSHTRYAGGNIAKQRAFEHASVSHRLALQSGSREPSWFRSTLARQQTSWEGVSRRTFSASTAIHV
ncbi:hypothetical protein BD413DRAFT_564466 [Trametes elegans]|nr:hypothetical protein BD413DRAFT_564466 [Trametes elegans]